MNEDEVGKTVGTRQNTGIGYFLDHFEISARSPFDYRMPPDSRRHLTFFIYTFVQIVSLPSTPISTYAPPSVLGIYLV